MEPLSSSPGGCAAHGADRAECQRTQPRRSSLLPTNSCRRRCSRGSLCRPASAVADAIERVYAGALDEHAGEIAHHLVKPGSLAYIQRLSTISPSQRNMDPTPPHMKTRCASCSPRCRARTSSTQGSKRIDGPTGNGGSRHREIGRDLPDGQLQRDSIARYGVPVVAAGFIRARISGSSASAHNLRQKPRSMSVSSIRVSTELTVTTSLVDRCARFGC
jgi:hypothetical protein